MPWSSQDVAFELEGAGPDALMRLLDDSRRTGVWPDSVQVVGGSSSCGCPPAVLVWLAIGLRPADHRDEARLKKGRPCS